MCAFACVGEQMCACFAIASVSTSKCVLAVCVRLWSEVRCSNTKLLKHSDANANILTRVKHNILVLIIHSCHVVSTSYREKQQ